MRESVPRTEGSWCVGAVSVGFGGLPAVVMSASMSEMGWIGASASVDGGLSPRLEIPHQRHRQGSIGLAPARA